jgi:hypothetical protein
LAEVASQLAQSVGLRGGLDALGADAHAETPTELDDAAHQRQVLLTALHLRDERSRHLQESTGRSRR